MSKVYIKPKTICCKWLCKSFAYMQQQRAASVVCVVPVYIESMTSLKTEAGSEVPDGPDAKAKVRAKKLAEKNKRAQSRYRAKQAILCSFQIVYLTWVFSRSVDMSKVSRRTENFEFM